MPASDEIIAAYLEKIVRQKTALLRQAEKAGGHIARDFLLLALNSIYFVSSDPVSQYYQATLANILGRMLGGKPIPLLLANLRYVAERQAKAYAIDDDRLRNTTLAKLAMPLSATNSDGYSDEESMRRIITEMRRQGQPVLVPAA